MLLADADWVRAPKNSASAKTGTSQAARTCVRICMRLPFVWLVGLCGPDEGHVDGRAHLDRVGADPAPAAERRRLATRAAEDYDVLLKPRVEEVGDRIAAACLVEPVAVLAECTACERVDE